MSGWGSTVGTATRYRLDDSGFEIQREKCFLHLSILALKPNEPPV